MSAGEPQLAEWQHPMRWRPSPNCLCPLTQQDERRAAAWRAAFHFRPPADGGPVARPKVAPTPQETELLVAYGRQLLGAGLEQFLRSGERPYGLHQGGGSFEDPKDPYVSHFLEHDGRGVSGARRLTERVAADRAWAAYWTARGYDQHNPGYQAHSPMPQPYRAQDTIATYRMTWEQLHVRMVAGREAEAASQLQPRLF